MSDRDRTESPAPNPSQPHEVLLRAFYLSRNVDVDAPGEMTMQRITLEEKNRQHEEWHRDFDKFLQERKKK